MTEDQLEQLCLEWFSTAGWEVLHGPDIAPDGPNPMRSNYQDVLLKSGKDHEDPWYQRDGSKLTLHNLLTL